jgi:hypothetical protein
MLDFFKPNAVIGPLKKVMDQPDLADEAKDRALYKFAAERCDSHKKHGVNKLDKAVKAAGKTSLKDIDDLARFLRGLIHTTDPNRFANEMQLAGAKLAIQYAAESGYLAKTVYEAVEKLSFVKTNLDIGPLKEIMDQPKLSTETKEKELYEFAAKGCDNNKRPGVNKLGAAVKAAGKASLKDVEDLAGFFANLIDPNNPNRFANEQQLAGAKLAIKFAAESGYLPEAAYKAVKSIKHPRARKQNKPGEKKRPLDSPVSDHSGSSDVGEPAEEAGSPSLSARAASAAKKGKKRIERSPSPDPGVGAFFELCRRFDRDPDETVWRWITQEAGSAASTRKLTLFDANDAPLFYEGRLLQFSESVLREVFDLNPADFQPSKRLRRETASARLADERVETFSQSTAPASTRPAEPAREAPASARLIDLNLPPALDDDGAVSVFSPARGCRRCLRPPSSKRSRPKRTSPRRRSIHRSPPIWRSRRIRRRRRCTRRRTFPKARATSRTPSASFSKSTSKIC